MVGVSYPLHTLRRLAPTVLILLLLFGPAAADREPRSVQGRLALAARLAKRVDELLGRTPPAVDEAEAVAARVLALRRRAVKPPHAELASGHLLLARVHERRADGRPRLDRVIFRIIPDQLRDRIIGGVTGLR
ncbi:MAG: hypothetical protein GY953_59190 [bacterium]|nr:hypothetical protein [bacterium]